MTDRPDLPGIDPEDNDNEITEPRPRYQQDDSADARLGSDALEFEQDDAQDDDDVPFRLPRVDDPASSESTFRHQVKPDSMPTMPHFREPGSVDPKVTLPGTGGLDPNPDMMPPVHQVPASEQTVVNLPRVQQPAPANPAIPRPQSEYTMPNPALADARYQRPAQQPARVDAQGQHVPPPPQAIHQQNPMPRRRRRGRILGVPSGCFFMALGLIVTFCGGLTFVTLGAAALFIPQIEEQWGSQIARVDDYRAFESTFFFDRYGNPLYEAFNEGRRDTVTYDRFPENLINATIAIEDGSFWSNPGIDVAATIVATLNFLGAESGERTPGGSTITQQLVRNVLFDFEYRQEVSVTRKAEEIVLAILLTARRSKEDILTLYLNEIYYGNLAYGAQAASQTFFGKNVQDLTLGEAALLAGLPQAPASLDPLNPDPEVQARVYARQRQVLDEMVDEGYITGQQRDQALREGLTLVQPELENLRAPHFTIYAQNEFASIMQSLGASTQEITRGGYRVYTTIDQNVNNLALGAARTQVANLRNNNVSNAAVVVLQPTTGQIISMIGSVDYNNDAIDGRVNVTIALRQPGSTMKPFTYAGAIERGMTPADVIWDTPTEIGIPGQPNYVPRNYDRTFHGPMTMRTALANSYNIPAVQALRMIGVDYLIQMMQRVGVSTLNDPSRYGLSLTLGGGEVSLLELSSAYGVFANQGTHVEPTSILCIIDSDNNIVYQYENGCPQTANFTPQTVDRRGFGTQVMDPRVAFVITDILSDNAARTPAMGARSPLYTANIATSVKTGTTDDVKDNWTMGYTRNVVVGVWVGNNNGDPLVGSSGLTGAAPIWNSVMNSIYSSPGALDVFRVDGQLLPDKPNSPAGMSLRQICDVRSMADPAMGCPRQSNEWFLDSPAGVPDGNGGLYYPDQVLANQPQSGGYLQEISPDIYRAVVFPINPAVASGIQFQVGAGELPPPPPRYCRVTPAQASIAVGAQEQYFVAGPSTSQSDAVRAEQWSQQNNFAFLPTIECWDGVFSSGAGWGSPVVTAVLTAPANGQVVSGVINFVGTVQFDASQAEFWHLDIIGGQWSDWTPMGTAGYTAMVNQTLFSGVLPPGNYRVRLRLVKDGNYIQQPYEVAFTVQ